MREASLKACGRSRHLRQLLECKRWQAISFVAATGMDETGYYVRFLQHCAAAGAEGTVLGEANTVEVL